MNTKKIISTIVLVVVGLWIGLSFVQYDGLQNKKTSKRIPMEHFLVESEMTQEGDDDLHETEIETAVVPQAVEYEDPTTSDWYLVPTPEVPLNIPFRDVVAVIHADTTMDVRIERGDEFGRSEDYWFVLAFDKALNDGRRRHSPSYYAAGAFQFEIYENATDFYTERQGYYHWSADEGYKNYEECCLLGVGEINLFGITWKYYDEVDSYSGGFERVFVYEKGGSIITFGVHNDILERIGGDKYPTIEDIPRIAYLKNLPF